MKNWLISKPDRELAARLAEAYDFPPFLVMLLVTRGFRTAEQVQAFLQDDEWSNPFDLIDMDKAVARIEQALDSQEPMLIYGDYDADGVTATTLLQAYLESAGGDVRYYIPTREGDGYGLNTASIDRIAEMGVRLLITVDNGISSATEIAYAKSLGIDTVVTDHHTPPEELPDAVAVVNPHRNDCPSKFKDLCGVGVALKLAAALEHETALPEQLLSCFGDLAAIGTVGDIVPLTGENRTIVRYGLRQIAECDRLGLRMLLESAGLSGKDALTAGNLSYTLVPRINAMGRMGSSDRVVQLFLTEDEDMAAALVADTEKENRERQTHEQDIFEKAAAQLTENPRLLMDPVLVVWAEGWHPGVLGIVASRLTEKYGKPSVVISIDGAEAKGSCRSLNGFSIIQALTAVSRLLIRFGGHTLAAGLTVPTDSLEAFRTAINTYALSLNEPMPIPVLNIDCKLNPAGISSDLVAQIKQLEPFGAGNPTPVFALMGMRLDGIRPVGGGKHLRLDLSREGNGLQMMLFRTTPQEFPYPIGEVLDLAVTLEESTFRGETGVSVYVRDVHPAGLDVEKMLQDKQRFEKYVRGESTEQERKELLPTREQLAAVYRLLRREQNIARPIEYLCSRLLTEAVGYDKLMTAVVAMRQVKLLRMHREADILTVQLLETDGKVALADAPILRKLRGETVPTE